MPSSPPDPLGLDPATREFYCHTLAVLRRARVRFLIGGAYAFGYYTGIERHTKDLDLFVHPDEFQPVLAALADAGYRTELPFPHWLGKARHGDSFVDVIFGSGNGVARVDEEWFEYAVDAHLLEVPVKLCPPEEILWTKAFVQERERFDGADVAHLLRARVETLDWQRLLRRFGGHWQVLFAHLLLFGFIYPGERARIPAWLLRALAQRLEAALRAPAPAERLCRGTLLSRQQYLVDLERWGYEDARCRADNAMTDDDIATWTAAIAVDGHA